MRTRLLLFVLRYRVYRYLPFRVGAALVRFLGLRFVKPDAEAMEWARQSIAKAKAAE